MWRGRSLRRKFAENVNEAHNTYFPLDAARHAAYYSGVCFLRRFRGERMRAAMLVGCAALLLSACSSEPVQQAMAAHVTPGMRAAMSDAGQANCAMIGGSLSVARQLDGSAIGMRAAERQTAAASRRWRAAAAATNSGPVAGSVSGTSTPASASGRRAYGPASGRRSPASTGFPSDRPAHPRAASRRSSHPGVSWASWHSIRVIASDLTFSSPSDFTFPLKAVAHIAGYIHLARNSHLPHRSSAPAAGRWR